MCSQFELANCKMASSSLLDEIQELSKTAPTDDIDYDGLEKAELLVP